MKGLKNVEINLLLLAGMCNNLDDHSLANIDRAILRYFFYEEPLQDIEADLTDKEQEWFELLLREAVDRAEAWSKRMNSLKQYRSKNDQK